VLPDAEYKPCDGHAVPGLFYFARHIGQAAKAAHAGGLKNMWRSISYLKSGIAISFIREIFLRKD